MRREHVRLSVENIDWLEADDPPRKPTVSMDVDGAETAVEERLKTPEGSLLDGDEIDVALRLQGPIEADTAGVVSVTNRLTGEFLLELNVDATEVLSFIRAARRFGEVSDAPSGRYEVTVCVDGEPLTSYEKRTFLVYDESGDLLRQHSLIPSGVEL